MYPYYYDDSPLRSGRPRKVRNPDLMPDDSDIADGSVTTSKIADGAVTEQKLADGSVSLTKLDGTVLNTLARKSDLMNFAPMIVASDETTAALLDSLGYTCETKTPADLSQLSINIAERMLICWMYDNALEVSHLSYRYDDDADQMVAFSRGQRSTIKGIVGIDSIWMIVEGNDIMILDGTVTESKVASNAITTSKIANDSITTNKITNNSVTADKLSTDAIPTMSTSVKGIAKVGAGLSMNGDSLELDGSGDIATAIVSWLNAHPEATTTVQIDSITRDKLNSSVALTSSELAAILV